VERNLAYGNHERQRLDVFKPVGADGPRPVLLFVHGGGFVAGDKGAPDAPFYNNIGAWAVQQGYVGVTMTYRLAPGDVWPAGSDDVASAVGFVRAQCARHGADADQVFVMGQSAGASHVAGYVAHPHYGAVDSIAGAILMSGMYDLTGLKVTPMERAYYGTEADRYPERSMLSGLATTEVPCLFSIAEMEPDHFQQQTGQVIKTFLATRGRLPYLQYYVGHNHVSPAMQIGGEEDDVGPSIARFIERAGSR
jgi:triacylglycerol lipase